jgi:serine phosphatase RsbU (regulator of sigma subunit)
LFVATLVVGGVVLIGLVSALTLIPAQALSATLSQQITEQQQLAVGSLVQQVESQLNQTANSLVALANRDEVRSLAPGQRDTARALFSLLSDRSAGKITAIVRLGTDGTPKYGWPDAIQAQIAANQPLPWRVEAGVMLSVTETSGTQLAQLTTKQGIVYVLVAAVKGADGSTQGLAAQLDLSQFVQQGLATLQLPDTAQVWVFDSVTKQPVYRSANTPAWIGSIDTFSTVSNVTAFPNYPAADRNAMAASIVTVLTPTQNPSPTWVVLVSRLANEGTEAVYTTLTRLFIGGVVFVIVLSALGMGLGRFVIIEENRRRREQERRSTVRTLLEMSRTLNSSLDLPVVLNKILDELAALLPHDSASVMLLDTDADEEEPTVTVEARRGEESEGSTVKYPLHHLRGAREVVRSGHSVVINDTRSDPRWQDTAGSGEVSAWMGVPLQIRNQAVGILNINSYQAERFGSDESEMAEAFADQACVAIENARAHEYQIRQYETELETARAIQTSLLPRDVPPVKQLEISAQSLPARHVSGDYYQYLPLPDGRLGIAVGDVSGKGIPAALLMAVVTTALREEVLRQSSPAALLNKLNASLIERMRENHMNSALMVAIFDPRTRRAEIANGGMVAPYVRTPSGWEFVPVGGYPLGSSDRPNYPAKTVTLAPGSALVCISDGVIESQNAEGEMYGFDRFEALLGSLPTDMSSAEIVTTILGAVADHLHGIEAQDDITVVVIRSVDL